jgi:hypothetical protein
MCFTILPVQSIVSSNILGTFPTVLIFFKQEGSMRLERFQTEKMVFHYGR